MMITITYFKRTTTRFILLLITSLLGIQHVAAESSLLNKVRAGDDVKIVLLGTSLTSNGTWPSSLQTWLNTESPGPGAVTVVNRAASGQASDHGINVQTPAALLDSPDAVFIEFSMNDAATSKNLTQLQSEANLNAIIDQFEAQNPNVIIVLQTMNSLPADTSPFSPRSDLNGYYQIYRDVAVERGAILIDHYPNWLDLFTNDFATWDSYMTDAVHPNALGQNTILVPELQSVLSTQSGPALPRSFLAAWDDWTNLSGSNTAPDNIGVTGFSANVVSGRNILGDFGSIDGSYGAGLVGANTTNVRALLPNQANPDTTFSITNNTGQPYTIDSLHFDFIQRFNSARDLTVNYVSGGLGPVSTEIHQQIFETIEAAPAGTPVVEHEYDFVLSDFLSDTTLDDRETATFEILLADFPGSNSTFIDNMAIRGTAANNPSNSAPSWSTLPVTEAVATETVSYSVSLADNARDSDSDPLTFAKVSGPAWLTVASNGALSGTPGSPDIGGNSFLVNVSDGIAAPSQTTLNINVNSFINRAPTFVTDPFSTANATVNMAYGGTVADSASDLDGDSLIFVKVGGPDWLTVAPNGTMSGTPIGADEGLNTFIVSTSDSEAPAVEAILEITVLPAVQVSTSVVLAEWDTWSDITTPYAPDGFAPGFTGSVATATDRINTDFGSTDGTFGNLTGADAGLGGLLVRETGGNLSVTATITNNTGVAYSINSLHFDFGARIVSPHTFTLTYTGGGLGNASTLIGSESNLAVLVGATQGASEGDYYDFDYDLSTILNDIILSDGESAEFVFVFSGHSSSNGSSIVDNIAFQGSPAFEGAPQLSAFDYDPVTGNSVITLKGQPNTVYKLVEADDLDFSNPDQNPIPLTGVSLGILSGNTVTTTAGGFATIEFNLGTTKPASFIRAETTP